METLLLTHFFTANSTSALSTAPPAESLRTGHSSRSESISVSDGPQGVLTADQEEVRRRKTQARFLEDGKVD